MAWCIWFSKDNQSYKGSTVQHWDPRVYERYRYTYGDPLQPPHPRSAWQRCCTLCTLRACAMLLPTHVPPKQTSVPVKTEWPLNPKKYKIVSKKMDMQVQIPGDPHPQIADERSMP